jgi:fibronectin type 3 domain-containing protein
MATTCMAKPLLSPKASSNVVVPMLPPVNVKAVTLASLIIPAVVAPPSAGRITLQWDASPDASVTGYRIYLGGESAMYTNMVPVNSTNTSVTLTNLGEGRKYFFAATARDAAGAESVLSNEAIGYTSARLSIRYEVFSISTSGVYGVTNDLMMATSLAPQDWTTVMTFTGNGSPVTYLHTNNLVGAFFKVVPR